ncbi:hypothetical protein QTG54_013626 [Skeletonema marinoi]|uniref:Uncharacterized protein n=1 Tax=Skeletonema marinoi TaxID=267567 RepID=A0AAD9D7B9_9STRA|nr:hypothetical protein QTG54_013626 [Skeletonema marinoi]
MDSLPPNDPNNNNNNAPNSGSNSRSKEDALRPRTSGENENGDMEMFGDLQDNGFVVVMFLMSVAGWIKKDKNAPSSGRGSPDSVSSDATPVTNNAAAPKKKKSDLHSLWEYRATSLQGNDPGSPPTTVRTTKTAWSNTSPRVVSPVASASSSPGPLVNKPASSDDELALLKKELDAIEAKKLAAKSSSSSPNVQPIDVKKKAEKFEVSKRKSGDELTLLKKELETLQGKKVEPKKDTPLQKKKSYLFWEQKTKDISPLAKNKSTSFNETGSAKSPGDDGRVAGAVTVAATATAITATAVTQGTSAAAAVEEEGSMPSEDKSFDNDSITSADTAQLMSEFRSLVEKLVRKAMPSEIDHVDELIEEYDGREEELLEILSAMQEEVDQEKASEDKGSAAAVAVVAGAATVATSAAVNSSQDEETGLENVGSFGVMFMFMKTMRQLLVSKRQINKNTVNTNSVKDDDDKNAVDAEVDNVSTEEDYDSVVSRTTADIGIVIVTSPDEDNSDIEKGVAAAAALTKSDRETCCKRNKVALLTLAIIVILSGAGAAIGIILSSPPGKEDNDKSAVFEEPIGTGRPLPESESDLSPGVIPDDIDTPPTVEEDLSTFCTSESSYSELPLEPGIGTKWQRGETFGILATHGDIASVSISGGNCCGSSGPVATGMVVTYERNPESGKWRQSKELVPDEYQGGALKHQNSDFGQSVSLYDDLLVVGAPSEDKDRGSVTVFKRDEKGLWDQVIKLARGAGTCQNADDIFLGYSVNVYENTIAVSADCPENIVLYEYDRTDSIVKSSQVLEWIDRKFGAVASITQNGEYLIYSTVGGGLFIFHREGDSEEFVLTQDLTFNNELGLFEYPVAMSSNLFALAVGNKSQLYTQAEQGGQWKREPVILVSDGEFDAYVKAGLAVSDGNVLLGSNTNIEAYDLSQCVPEMVIPDVVISEPNCLVVNVTLDNYPSDTTWQIEDSDGNAVASNTPYDESMAATTQVEEVCDLSDGGYTFAIFDEYEDGMCCKWGEGSYTLSTKNGLTIASGGEFGASEKTQFSIPFSGDSAVTTPTPNDQTSSPTKQPSLSPTTTKPTPTPTDAPVTSEPTDAPVTDTPTVAPVTSEPTEQPTSKPTTQAPVQPTCTTIEVSLTLDDYPQDTSWNVVGSTGEVVAKSPAYDASMAGSTEIESLCLQADTYSFDIYDVYEDGMCCDWGQGSYTLSTKNGDILATGGEWLGPSETKTFQLS